MGQRVPLPLNYAPDFDLVAGKEVVPCALRLNVRYCGRCYVEHQGLALHHMTGIPETTAFPALRAARTRQYTNYARYRRIRGPNMRLRRKDILLLHYYWAVPNYLHWLLEVLVKVQFVEPERFAVLCPAWGPDIAMESLRLFPWADVIAMPAGMGALVDGLTVVETPVSGLHGDYNADNLTRLRAAILERTGATQAAPVRLYLTRSSVKRRTVANEAATVSALEEYGFEVVDTAGMTFAEQVRLFARCEALVSPHGAGLANMLFMSPGSPVLELASQTATESEHIHGEFWRLSYALGLPYLYQYCANGENHGRHPIDVDMIVDIDRLRRNVELMLAA